MRALAKLEQVLPSRLRHRVAALSSATVPLPVGGPSVGADVLTAIAATVRDHERLRFDYVGHDGGSSRREVEPHRLVNRGRRWYLVAWDVDRSDWRTFRVDRMTPTIPTGPRFAPREAPSGDVAGFVARGLDYALWSCRASLRLHASADAVAQRLPASIVVEPGDEHTCVVHTGADSYEMIAVHLAMLDVDFDVLDPPEFADHLRRTAARYLRAADTATSA
ncbi:WYL domain-containing protein [Jiangella rhizosphaerae]|uniref:WYL domain-containing protein n=1 Tax=Jiangella rhizosphaerae TaxID=2293569 RepID=A0A418KQ80_9ACTN|nr:WYL domain-containing protein [Jiangella rhizosphaerae]